MIPGFQLKKIGNQLGINEPEESKLTIKRSEKMKRWAPELRLAKIAQNQVQR